MKKLQYLRPSFKGLIYVQQFIGDCMPIYPLYGLMFASRSGLDNSTISLLFFSWVIIAMLSEIPTGIIADKFSRKSALVYSYILQGIAFIIWLALPSFWGYATGFAIWGVGYAFSSGTFQAYLYEELKSQGDSASFNKVFARSQSIKMIGMILAYAAAPLIGATNYIALLIVSSAGSFLAAILSCFLPYQSRRITKSQSADSSYIKMITNAFIEIGHSKKLWPYTIALGATTGMLGVIEEFSPLLYKNFGFSTDAIAIIMTLGVILSSGIGWFAHRLQGLRYVTVAMTIAIASIALFASALNQYAGLVSLLLFVRVMTLAQTLFGASMQHVLKDDHRATVGSIASFAGSMLSLAILALAAISFNLLGTSFTYQLLSLIFLTVGLALVAIGRSKHLKVDAPVSNEPLVKTGRPV